MPATFYSKAANFQVVLEPKIPVHGVQGQESWTQGKRVQFVRGQFVATEQEAKKIGLAPSDLVAKLREAQTYGVEFFEPENDPRQIHPRTEDLLADIMSCVARGNEKRLLEIVAQEEDSHQRPEVLVSARRALGELGNTTEGKRGPGRPPVKAQAGE